MNVITEGFGEAFRLIIGLDPEFLQISLFSLQISLLSTFFSALCGIPLGLLIGLSRTRLSFVLQTIVNTCLSLPTVLIGLILYSLLSRSGPLGAFGLLFSPTAMILGQICLGLPLAAGFIIPGIRQLGRKPALAARLLGAKGVQVAFLYLAEIRQILLCSLLAVFGRVFAEVGVSLMLGGNIRFYTRNITTSIALETSKGNFGLGIALGLVLMAIALCVNLVTLLLKRKTHDAIH
jgi:tungstate transport system permease protein